MFAERFAAVRNPNRWCRNGSAVCAGIVQQMQKTAELEVYENAETSMQVAERFAGNERCRQRESGNREKTVTVRGAATKTKW